MSVADQQRAICEKYGAPYCPVQRYQKVGVARNLETGLWPVNGVRYPGEGDTSGWYIWAGEVFSTDSDFFVPLHIAHLDSWRPQVLPYLALPAGWPFLTAPDYEDVWPDPTVLDAG